MPVIHFLNVGNGSCSIIQHYSRNVTVIDVNNAKYFSPLGSQSSGLLTGLLAGYSQNQKQSPENPVKYLLDHNISSVFRFILTHPDMDHMGGIKAFFNIFKPVNFWDTDNNEEKQSFAGSPYNEEDWKFYKALRDENSTTDPKRLTLLPGTNGKYFNVDKDGKNGGDGLFILAPNADLIQKANESSDYNDSSYVILYKTDGHKIIFSGDSHDKTWEYILNNHFAEINNIDLLIAPHHGRKSKRSYEFLDYLRPKITFFGNASSNDLAYSAWNYRKLPFVTNNQGGNLVVWTTEEWMSLYASNFSYAYRNCPGTFYSDWLKAYYCKVFKQNQKPNNYLNQLYHNSDYTNALTGLSVR